MARIVSLGPIAVDADASPWIAKALEALCATGCLLEGLRDGGIGELPACASATQGPVGVLHWLADDDLYHFFDPLAKLWDSGTRAFVLLTDSSERYPWSNLSAAQRAAFGYVFEVVRLEDESSLSTALDHLRGGVEEATKRRAADGHWTTRRIESTLDAYRLNARLRGFLHGTRTDISNRFLAPARLLALAKRGGLVSASVVRVWKDAWADVQSALRGISAEAGTLAEEFAHAAGPISSWLDSVDTTSESVTLTVAAEDFARVMALLTDCRVLAGQQSEASQTALAAGTVVPVAGRVPGYRVLVVDDHAGAWRPVFEALAEALAREGSRVDFYFSLDGATLGTTDGRNVPVHFGAFDLIILDILLGKTADGRLRDGRDILKEEIRRDLAHQPVLIWTTSRDDEITTKAAQANGLLLKKALSWSDLCDGVYRWLPEGRAKGSFSLPSPLFNHTIRVLDPHRFLARDFTDWCLKQLDSFHALDGGYFRYFTDHGGRHIVKLLEYTEQLLVPFLTTADARVFSPENDRRQFELLSLYVAVVAHELGMFPMRISEEIEEFDRAEERYLDNVRQLHALRGMLLFAGDQPLWIDEEGRDLGRRMNSITVGNGSVVSLSDAVAVLVGHHSRCLEGLEGEGFLEWTAPPTRFKSLDPNHMMLSEDDFARTVRRLCALMKSDPGYRDRIRRQCALLRFADSIDISTSRNPASFLLHGAPGEVNQREYLKRQVCKRLEAQDGQVKVVVSVPLPTVESMRPVLSGMLSLQVEDKKRQGVTRQVVPDGKRTAIERLDVDALQRPWDTPSGRAAALILQKPLDECLQAVWQLILTGSGDALPRGPLVFAKNVGLLVEKDGGLAFAPGGRQLLASMTALSVAGELLDEYRAIEHAGLQDSVHLQEFRPEPWSGEAVPANLTVLARALS